MIREGATVKKFLDALEDMRSVYQFKDEDTNVSTLNYRSLSPDALTVTTKDERTGVFITMSKDLGGEV